MLGWQDSCLATGPEGISLEEAAAGRGNRG